jgi:hypothetical protein
MFNTIFSPKIIAGQATDDNIIRRTRTACWISKATDIRQTDTQNIKYLLPFLCINSCAKGSRYYITRTLPVLFVKSLPHC